LIRYQLANHLGSSVLELDQHAQVISYEEYYPYGSTSYQAVRLRTETPKRYRYTGKERDTETGLYYHGARYYAPWLARWTSCDPVGMADGTNPYLYARCQPIARTDPSGLQSQKDQEPSGEPESAPAPTGHNLVAANNPIRTVGPAGRQPTSRPQSTARAPGRAGPNAKGSGTGKPSSGVLGVVRAATEWFFEGAASVLRGLGWLARNILPGLIAAPVGGAFDMLAGLTRVVGGILSLNGSNLVGGLKDIGLGFLSIFGLKEVLTEKWIPSPGGGGMPTTGLKLPVTMTKDIQLASKEVPENAGKNGYHAWHAADTAAVSNRVGPVGSVGVWIAGVIHETPVDQPSYKEEEAAQGSVNHFLDSMGDIFANTFGMLLGLLLPRIVAIKVAAFLGNFIPGPADPTAPFGKARGKPYKGDPAVNWSSRL
jgi:RHS repeat-associated protein